jgi:predicted nucleic acid-binding protein
VSALIADGPPSRLLEEAIDGQIELVLPELALEELRRVLREKLGFDEERARAASELLAQLAIAQPGTPQHVDAITGDPADDAILACALESQVDVLATGARKHLLPLGEHRGVRLLTPQAVLAELRAAEG